MLQSPVKEQINTGILKGLEDVKERRWLNTIKFLLNIWIKS